MSKYIKQNNAGFGLIEILLVISVGMATFLGIEQYLNLSLSAVLQDTHQVEALYRVKASLEQARTIRDENWTKISAPDLPLNTPYHFAAAGTNPDKWLAVAGSIVEGNYTIWITTSSVSRDGFDDITTVGGTVDSNILKINSNVSWLENGITKQITISEYLVNF